MRFDEVGAEVKTAIDLDPTSYFHQLLDTFFLTYARRNDEAVRQLERLAEMNPNNADAIFWLVAGGLTMPGNDAELFERLTRFQQLSKTDEQIVRRFKTSYQTSGWQGVLRERAKIVDQTDTILFFAAAVHAQIGNKDKAFEYLEESYQRREMWMAYLQGEPRLDPLRDDPRYDELVRRVESK